THLWLLIGNLHQVGLNLAKYFMDHHKEFGNMFEVLVGSKRFIVLSHASLIDQIFISSTKSDFFTRILIPNFQKDGMQHCSSINSPVLDLLYAEFLCPKFWLKLWNSAGQN